VLGGLLAVLKYSFPLTPTGTSFGCRDATNVDFVDTLMIDTLFPICLTLFLFVVYNVVSFINNLKSSPSESGAFKRWIAKIKPSDTQQENDDASQNKDKDEDRDTDRDRKKTKAAVTRKQIKELLTTCIFLFAWLIFLILPKVTVVIFNAFPCVDVDPDGVLKAQGLPTRYLRADMSISCSSPRYYFGVSWGIAMVFVFPVGVPLLYIYLLYINRKAIKTRSTDDDRDVDNSETTAAESSEDRVKHLITHEEIKFLWSNYLPKFWYWEVVETIRRLLLTGVLSIIYEGTSLQIVVGMTISLCFVYVYDHCRPYPKQEHNLLQEVAEYVVLLFLLGALLLRTQAFKTGFVSTVVDDKAIGVAPVVLVSLFMSLVVHFAMMDLSSRYKQGIVWMVRRIGLPLSLLCLGKEKGNGNGSGSNIGNDNSKNGVEEVENVDVDGSVDAKENLRKSLTHYKEQLRKKDEQLSKKEEQLRQKDEEKKTTNVELD
jgi:hypothetical protein